MTFLDHIIMNGHSYYYDRKLLSPCPMIHLQLMVINLGGFISLCMISVQWKPSPFFFGFQ